MCSLQLNASHLVAGEHEGQGRREPWRPLPEATPGLQDLEPGLGMPGGQRAGHQGVCPSGAMSCCRPAVSGSAGGCTGRGGLRSPGRTQVGETGLGAPLGPPGDAPRVPFRTSELVRTLLVSWPLGSWRRRARRWELPALDGSRSEAVATSPSFCRCLASPSCGPPPPERPLVSLANPRRATEWTSRLATWA